jgi:D-alanyl-D-alanine carboxypeptidase
VVPQAFPIGSNIGLQMGEKLTVEQLLYAMLVQSANDAAEVFAALYPNGRAAFVDQMNVLAESFHLTNTHFLNPTGIDEPGHYSSAADLARLADVALRNPEFAKIVTVENAVVSDHVISNTNELVGRVAGVKGIKTGFTEGAGQALVSLVERDGHEIIVVVLGSIDRFGDSEKIIEWTYQNFAWKKL